MDPWKDFSARHEHCLAHYLELLAEAEQVHRVSAVLANQPRKAPVFTPALAWLGRRLVRWGTRLHARYDEAWHDSVQRRNRRKGAAMNKKDIQVLYAYNRWANARILGAAAKISAPQFLAPTTFPHGGLRGTLVHTLFGEWIWRMRWQGSPPNVRWKPEDFPTFASLKTRWRKEEILLMEFVDSLTEKRLTAEFDYISTEGNPHRRVVWEAMAHLVNHGTQHRSEAAAMLTDMGHSPGDIDLIVFLNEDPPTK